MIIRIMLGSVTAVALLCNVAHAQVLDDGANMKILKARAQLLHYNKKELGKQTNDKLKVGDLAGKVECGSVDIGNQSVNSGFGKDIEIIITGDIINTNNHCMDLKK